MQAPDVLIADNDRAVCGLLGEVVRRMGYRVGLVHDGEAARQALASQQVRVLVCDLDMPRMTGLEVIEWLQGRSSPPAVVVISGYVDGTARQQLMARPCVREVLSKPFDLVQFGDVIRGLCASGAAPAAESP